jgi:hypothetical protein
MKRAQRNGGRGFPNPRPGDSLGALCDERGEDLGAGESRAAQVQGGDGVEGAHRRGVPDEG